MIVDELKKSILYYAFAGKLTDNNMNVEDILNSKSTNDWEYSTKQNIKIRNVEKKDELFELPENWKWVRLHQICSYIQRGKSPKYSKIKEVPVIAQKCNQWDGLHMDRCLFVDPNDVSKYTKERFLVNDDILINSTGGGSCGRIGIYDSKLNSYGVAVADSHITVCRPYNDIVLSKYIYYYLSSPMVQSVIESQAVGTTNQIELTIDTIRNYLIPFTDINNQIRIVDKIEELFAKLDEIKPIEEELQILKSKFPENMKRSIIDYAIHGKLSQQDINDSDIDRLIPEKIKLKNNYKKFNLTINKEEYPFQIPSNWKWVKLGMLFDYQNGYSYKPSETSKSGKGYPVIKSQNIMKKFVENNSKTVFVENPTPKMLKSKINKGDFLMCLSSQSDNPEPLGKTAIYEYEDYALLNQRVLKLVPINYDFSRYLYYVINSFYFHNTVSSKGGGSAQSNLKLEHVMEMYIPLPSLEEQQRIVDKLELLLPLCDEIENLVKENYNG